MSASEAPSGAAPAASREAVIHDVRYSRFTGELRPRVFAVLALASSSFLRALGIRKSAAAKILPFALVGVAYLPALAVVLLPLLFGDVFGQLAEAPTDLLSYYQMLDFALVRIVIVAFVAVTIPSLLTRDRRERVLSLYFSTALSPAEYLLGKVLAALALVLLVTLGPLLTLWVGSVLVVDEPLTWAQEHIDEPARIVAASLVYAAYHAALALGIASLTDRRIFALGGYLALMLVTPVVAVSFYEVAEAGRSVLLLDLFSLPLAVVAPVLEAGQQDFGAYPGPAWILWMVLVLAGTLTLAARYGSGRES